MTFTPGIEPEEPARPRGSALPVWLAATGATVAMIGASVADMRFYPHQFWNPAVILGVVFSMAGHGLFVAADCVRRGRSGRVWGTVAAVAQPLALWLYFVAEYRGHAFWQIPVSFGYYFVVLAGVPALIGAG